MLFGRHKIWDIAFGIAHCTDITDYSWLIPVINEVCALLNNAVSFCKKKTQLLQRNVTLRVISNSQTLHTLNYTIYWKQFKW